MSILIKGMEMPQGDDELRLIIHSNGQVIISHETYFNETEAIPVLPHGKLIDADALIISTAVPLDGKPYQYVHIDNIKNASTIIPAEEGE